MNKFLIINPFGIGDVLFTAPVIRAIRDNYPDSVIGYWCNERVSALFKDDPNINRVFALSRGDLKKLFGESILKGTRALLSLLRLIKKERFEAAFDFSLDHRYGLIAKILGIKKRIGYNYKGRGRFLTDKIDIEGYNAKHIVQYYLELLRFIGVRAKTNNLYLFVSEHSKSKARQALARAGVEEKDFLIGIAPGAGASWGKDAHLKHWPAIRFARVADRLIQELNAKIVILADESERPISDVMVNAMKNEPLDLAGKTNLEDLAAVMANLKVLVTNDGGPLHMACALGLKTVSIFGPVDERVYGPYPASSNHIVIRKDLACRPCYNNFRMSLCDKDRQCIKSISRDEVFEAVRRLA